MSSLGLLVYSFWKSAPINGKSRTLVVATIGVFVYALLSTLMLGGHLFNTLFAPSYMWTGVLSLLCVILLAWLIAPRMNQQIINYFFWTMCGVALSSFLVSLPSILGRERLGGIVVQPNILAILLGCGLIAGLYAHTGGWTRYRWAGIASLLVAVLLTQTRAVILMLPFIFLPILIKKFGGRSWKLWGILGASLLIVALFVPRLGSADRLKYGVTYRYDLATYSMQQFAVMPPWGLGPGGLSEAAGRYYPSPASLQATALIDHKLPESSHMIIVDRFLEYGWLAGVAYVMLVTMFIVEGIRKRHDPLLRIIFAIGSFVLIQHLVTVARFHTELIAWVAMLTVIVKQPKEVSRND